MVSEAEIESIRSIVSSKEGVAYAILFGSALGCLLIHSDIDLMIGGDPGPREKADLLSDLTVSLGREVNIISPGEARCEVVLRAFSSGVAIFVRDKEGMKEDYFRNYRLCDEGKPLKRIRFERLRRVYGNG